MTSRDRQSKKRVLCEITDGASGKKGSSILHQMNSVLNAKGSFSRASFAMDTRAKGHTAGMPSTLGFQMLQKDVLLSFYSYCISLKHQLAYT